MNDLEKEKDLDFGYIPSIIDGTEHKFGCSNPENISMPVKYSYKRYLPNVLDQGNDPICVPCSISAYINWNENLKDGSKKDNKVNLMQIYHSKTTKGGGMTFKDALRFLRHHGVETASGIRNINEYAMISDPESLKYALVMNGPCIAALPVFGSHDDFWNRKFNQGRFLGYHAISIVGYDKDGFIIRNSWGTKFAEKGYTHIKFDEYKKFVEVWTII